MRRSPLVIASTLLVFGLVAGACGSDSKSSDTTAAPTTKAPAVATTPATTAVPAASTVAPVTGDVVVFAAASLTAAFTAIGDAFKVDNPGANVTFNFAASSDLVTQINQGAPADAFASADENNMKKLTDAAGNAGDPVIFATNSLAIMVAPGNPKGITGVKDLANNDLIVVLCAPEVPCGKYAGQVFTNAGVTVTPKSLEENVKAVVTKVTAGEADAGIVYETDVLAAKDKAAGVEIPAAINVVAKYPIVATKEAKNSSGAKAFIDFVLSEAGQKILASYGFKAP
jgi:molybdate transport system substrate-binding protein